MLRELVSAFSFLTIIPAGNANLETVARYMHVFPIVGIAIGLIVGAFGFGLSEAGINSIIVGLLVVAVIAIITGMHHTDGLADFADGLAAKGTIQKKLSAMKDVSVGSSGIATIILYFIGMIVALSLADGFELFLAILFAEITAKFSMVLMVAMGQSAALGSNSPFVSSMKNKKKLIISLILSLIPLLLLGGADGLVVLGTGITVSLFMVGLSTRSFGGITGDVLGATNEISRLASILVFVSI